jgi:hypothetical protein
VQSYTIGTKQEQEHTTPSRLSKLVFAIFLRFVCTVWYGYVKVITIITRKEQNKQEEGRKLRPLVSVFIVSPSIMRSVFYGDVGEGSIIQERME